MDLRHIQAYLQEQGVDGWLLYNFRDLNPIAISVAGLPSGGSRRWFLWIPAHGAPRWLIHAIEGNMFVDARPELAGEKLRYVSWQEMAQKLAAPDRRRERSGGQPQAQDIAWNTAQATPSPLSAASTPASRNWWKRAPAPKSVQCRR